MNILYTARCRKAAMLALFAAGVLIVLAALFYATVGPLGIGPEQPISFSHRVHAGDKQISCLVCHPGTVEGQRAGIPPLETCMLCHEHVIITHPEILKLRRHYDERRPVEWVQVYDVPEFAYFDHQAHVRKQVDCGQCHGPVKAMDRMAQYREFTMGFCVQCHRDNNVSHDCLICHR